jgi:hypothetical protein
VAQIVSIGEPIGGLALQRVAVCPNRIAQFLHSLDEFGSPVRRMSPSVHAPHECDQWLSGQPRGCPVARQAQDSGVTPPA